MQGWVGGGEGIVWIGRPGGPTDEPYYLAGFDSSQLASVKRGVFESGGPPSKPKYSSMTDSVQVP